VNFLKRDEAPVEEVDEAEQPVGESHLAVPQKPYIDDDDDDLIQEV